MNQAETVLTTYEYYTLLERLGAKLEDGQSMLCARDGSFRGMLPIRLKYIEGALFVTATEDPEEIPLYSVLIGVDGSPVSQHLQFYIEPLIGLQTPLAREQQLAERLCLGNAQRRKIESAFTRGETLNLQNAIRCPTIWLWRRFIPESRARLVIPMFSTLICSKNILHISAFTLWEKMRWSRNSIGRLSLCWAMRGA